jgi:hypothetical protein
MLKKNVFVLGFFYSLSSFAFDLEDYAGSYRSTRDAYLKAANELKLASGPYKAARDGYKGAAYNYLKTLGNGKEELDQSILAGKKRVCYFNGGEDRAKDTVMFSDLSLNPIPNLTSEQNDIINLEMNKRLEYFAALEFLEKSGKAKSASVQAYRRGMNEYLHSLTLPTDLTVIQRKLIENKK